MSEKLLDDDGENRAVRAFLMHYGAPGLTVKQQRDNMRRAGWGGCWPGWVPDVDGHLTKAGAQAWLRHLFSLEQPDRVNGGSFDALPPEMEWRLAVWLTLGKELHPLTINLVVRFSRALAAKLADAEQKYGYSDGWRSPDWMDECRAHLMEHIAKGDPRDVAAYCAFLWHHGESTAAGMSENKSEGAAGVTVVETMSSPVPLVEAIEARALGVSVVDGQTFCTPDADAGKATP